MQNTEQQGDKYGNHAQVWGLLPWYINGSLSSEEKQKIAEHTAVCLACRKEFVLQSALRESVKDHELDELMMAASFDRLAAKLQEQDAGPPHSRARPARLGTSQSGTSQRAPSRHVRRLADGWMPWLRRQFNATHAVAALAVLALIALLPGFTAAVFPGNNTFRTLSNGQAESPASDLRLIFADGVSAPERTAILDSAGLSIVAGPDERGLYFVDAPANVSAEVLAAAVEQLRRNENIMFAELAVGAAPGTAPSGEQ